MGKGLQLDLFKHHEIELKDKSLNRKKLVFFKVNNGIVSVWKYTGKLVAERTYKSITCSKIKMANTFCSNILRLLQ